MYIYIHIHMYVCVYIYICIHLYVYVYTYVFNIHTNFEVMFRLRCFVAFRGGRGSGFRDSVPGSALEELRCRHTLQVRA